MKKVTGLWLTAIDQTSRQAKKMVIFVASGLPLNSPRLEPW